VNKTRLPLANICIEIEYFNSLDKKPNTVKINTPVFPKDTQLLTMNVSAWHYGSVEMKIKKCTLFDMLKLFKMKIKNNGKGKAHTECSFSVVPECIPIDASVTNYADSGLESDVFSKTHKGDDPSEIFDIHEYCDGDKINRIHWKISAKQGKTMIKDYSLPIANSVVLMINLDIESVGDNFVSDYDTLIEAVAAVSGFLTESETPHRAVWYDPETDGLKTYDITDEDEFNVFIIGLLKTPLCNEKDMALIRYEDSDDRARCGHLIYFTAQYNTDTADIMTESTLAMRYTEAVICNEDNTFLENDSEVAVVPVAGGHIDEAFAQMCL
jgi:hypothetical protein